ncbi:glycoside/pentoside/hexuronide:cation symporter, GPH family [Sphingomonas palmae]|uniref:Glycoside/pentoside/hexuronide:cation symporter, GPH family n=1 Tax=Sphingomonas palmae TaxID=1855283 RepID=A0A1H7TCT8_9SPHN|nr:MFS transporter [Sphingomonas palmae]SEL82553.1 glycoside/pentoside/hexuronide:cation symporter, GPH family [Sphingomonas palmae]
MTRAAAPAGASSAPKLRRLTPATMASYGVGAAAYGVKDSGFGTFLLLFYNQVIGVPAATVGLVIMCALIIDAFVDPTVGFFSDRTRTRWGRRHPWMYGAALPIMLGWLMLWNPPLASEQVVLGWLFVVAVLVRSAVSAYEVPSQALAAELSGDYDERTRIMAYRYLFGWAGGLLMLVSAYVLFLAPTPDFPNGLLNRAGYKGFAIAGALFMGATILISALGTHKEIPNLPKPPVERQSLADNFREMRQTVKNRAFAILMLAGLFAYTSQGITYAMTNYLYSYVWGLRGFAFVWLSVSLFAGVAIAFVAAPRIGAIGSKPRGAATAALLGMAIGTTPYWLRLAGLFPPIGAPVTLPLLFTFAAAATACGVTAFILGASMLADVVEDSEITTGRRSEGVFFSGGFFIQKCTSGVGIFLGGLILTAANFPAKAQPGQVPVAVLDRLTLIYAGCYVVLGCLAAFFYSRFPFGRAEHALRMERLTGASVIDAAPREPVG